VRPTTALRKLIAGEQIVVAPGVYDGMSARLVQRAGFAAAYATGGGIARSMGYPDLGLLGLTEVAERLSVIVEHVPPRFHRTGGTTGGNKGYLALPAPP